MADPREQPDDADRDVSWLPEEIDVETPPRIGSRRLLTAAGSLLLVAVLLGLVLPWATGATWPGILASLAAMPAWAVPAVALLGVGAVLLEAMTVRTAVRGARYPSALAGHAASSALGMVIPGGSLLGPLLLGWMLRRTGIAVAAIVTGILTASLVETVVSTVLVPVVGLLAYALAGPTGTEAIDLPGAIWAVLVALVVGGIALALAAVLLRRGPLTAFLGQLGPLAPSTLGGRPLVDVVLAERDALVERLRTRTAGLLLPTILARALQCAALALAVRATGADVPLLLVIAVFALGRVLALLPLTPGGVGIAETAGAAALIALGAGAEAAASAMLLAAVATLVVPLVLGGAAALPALARRR
ncbi:lysylphosphatidylglycerol synthase domain-containing protein [Brachybacterium sp. DNPG3]